MDRLIDLVGRVFANDGVIPKTLKMVLDTSLLNTQQYKVRIYPGAIQGKGKHPPLHLGVVAIEKGAFWLPTTKGDNFTLLIIIIIIILLLPWEFSAPKWADGLSLELEWE